eukprot:CAMPEP_0168322960 /NCGR_PEP_ID=MMETSP0213-20121227/3199_1 /TAXON_ID=151035 /ORGANISM="Euplotes harpa, Strain FSP1.4" /LENGTH=71 /DNA_ID=CAMNT_0008324945 /DNA_START=507 /DNA_END=719 /DNA_ORIENTATION=-
MAAREKLLEEQVEMAFLQAQEVVRKEAEKVYLKVECRRQAGKVVVVKEYVGREENAKVNRSRASLVMDILK